jgi:hypothetical protein
MVLIVIKAVIHFLHLIDFLHLLHLNALQLLVLMLVVLVVENFLVIVAVLVSFLDLQRPTHR